MKPMNLEHVVRNIDRRLERVGQILPTLPTREELDQRIAPLATREELDQILDRKLDEKLGATLNEKLGPLTVRMDAFELRVTEEFERSRRHTQVLFESLMDRISIVADGFAATDMDLKQAVHPKLADHNRRISALEVERGMGRREPRG